MLEILFDSFIYSTYFNKYLVVSGKETGWEKKQKRPHKKECGEFSRRMNQGDFSEAFWLKKYIYCCWLEINNRFSGPEAALEQESWQPVPQRCCWIKALITWQLLFFVRAIMRDSNSKETTPKSIPKRRGKCPKIIYCSPLPSATCFAHLGFSWGHWPYWRPASKKFLLTTGSSFPLGGNSATSWPGIES